MTTRPLLPLALLALALLALALAHAAAAQPADRTAARDRVADAMRRQDYPAALLAEAAWAKQHPTDLEFRHIEPLLHRLLGDTAAWDRSRADLLRVWQRTPTPETPARSFTIDLIPLASGYLVAEQCYEQAGRFGVSYRIDVHSPDNRLTGYFTVESPPAENQMRREMNLPSPSYTLDYFTPGRHETVSFLPGAPVYADMRTRALAHLADPKPISGSGTGSGLANVGCEVGSR